MGGNEDTLQIFNYAGSALDESDTDGAERCRIVVSGRKVESMIGFLGSARGLRRLPKGPVLEPVYVRFNVW